MVVGKLPPGTLADVEAVQGFAGMLARLPNRFAVVEIAVALARIARGAALEEHHCLVG